MFSKYLKFFRLILFFVKRPHQSFTHRIIHHLSTFLIITQYDSKDIYLGTFQNNNIKIRNRVEMLVAYSFKLNLNCFISFYNFLLIILYSYLLVFRL